MKKYYPVLIALTSLVYSNLALSEEHVVSQKNKEFSMSAISIKAGDSISFLNEDDFHHNVFSLSDSILFDLGSYDKGMAKSVTFEEPGIVDVECAIHPNMKLTVTVE